MNRLAGWLVVGSFLFFTSQSFDVFSIPRIWLVSLACFMASWSPRPAPPRGAAMAWTVFFCAFILSTVCSVEPWMSLVGTYHTGWETARNAVLAWLCFELGRVQDREDIYRAMRWSAVIGAGYVVLQAIGLDFHEWGPLTDDRMPGAMGHPAWTALVLAMSVPAVVDAAYERGDRRWWGGAALLLIAGYLTMSRGAFLAAAIFAAWYMRSRLGRFAVPAAAVCVAAVLVMCYRSMSDGMRVAQTVVSGYAIAEHPILGWGPGTGMLWFLSARGPWSTHMMEHVMTVQVHSHNIITNVLATQGLVGFAAWVLLAFAAWRPASPVTRGIIIIVAVVGMVNPISHVAYFVLALHCGMDNRGDGAPAGRPWWTAIAAAAVFVSMSMSFLSDTMARAADVAQRRGQNNLAAVFYLKADRVSPLDFYYSAKAATLANVVDARLVPYILRSAHRSLSLHLNNPIACTTTARALRRAGMGKEAKELEERARKLDKMKKAATIQ